ncbi:MAG: NAD(P)H-dependent oxidoreductase subunit E [Rhizobiales bacterium]|nr:NAD(P)H-dependent oxidoreductase subunit E [Hyphomicrobiales bacterium]
METTKTTNHKQRKKPRGFLKGRQTNEEALKIIKDLIGAKTQRDHLIEYLHKIQDTFGGLSSAHLRALAELMNIPQIEVYEVASFYAHFDIVKEGEEYPAPITIRVCNSITCALKGSQNLFESLKLEHDPNEIRILEAPCLGRCAHAPACHIGKNSIDEATKEKVHSFITAKKITPEIPDYKSYRSYTNEGGYKQLDKFRKNELKTEEIISTLEEAGLAGLGGAGFPSGKKWQFVKSYQGPRLMTVNGDEGEPGTFKDRHCIETNPHQFLEGMLIAAHAVEAERIYIYMRDEFPTCLDILQNEIKALENRSIIKPGFVELRRGAGAYICGEESAMIESIEGKRGLPRHRPPYIAEVGLFNRPTLNHNVETLFWIPKILSNGAKWFSNQGTNGSKGPRSWSVSGWVKKPGVLVAPAGITVNELIEQAGGMQEGHQFKAYLPGGASGGILPASLGDLPLDFGSLAEQGCFVGSHAIVILSDKDDMRKVALNLLEFFEEESCGQCTPCRVGCEKAVKLMKNPSWDIELLEELSTLMIDASICGLGQAAPNPIKSIIRYFREDIT